MFDKMVNASKALLDAAGMLTKLQDDRRERLADFFTEIADVLRDIVQRKETGQRATDLCAEIVVFADALPEVAGRDFPSDKVRDLSDAIWSAHLTRQLLFYCNNPWADKYDEYVAALEEVSGTFRALAKTIRAQH